MSSELVWTLVVAVAMAVGLLGVLVPVLPGLMMIVAAAVGYGLAVGFGPVAWSVLAVMALLLAASFALGLVIPQRHAERAGTAKISQWAALGVGIIGFFVVPVVGAPVGALVGALLAEYWVKGDWDEAKTATIGLAKGLGISILIDLVIGFVMVGLWAVWALTVLL